ncbi:MAG: antibiotic biosynthesis monooxygenase [Anaerolineae bacterium]|nr:antibiotic biosynthesis monooxygenase [Anaerolineae bacterium]
MPIYQTVRFQVRPESLTKCQTAIREFVRYVRDNEGNTLLYIALQEKDDPTRFLHYFVFQDEEARERHQDSDAVTRFTSILYPETLAPVEFTEYKVVAST